MAKTVSVPATQIVADNAYLAGGQVNFLTTAQKDLIAAGGQVTVNGPVWGDVLLAGGSVEVLQPVRGDVRVLGGQVTIGNSVTGDVIVGGGSVTVLPGVVIGGDVVLVGGNLDMEATVNGELRAYGGDVTINGIVAGPVLVKAGKSLSFGDKTVLGSMLTYSAPQEASVAQGAKLGTKVVFNKQESKMPGWNPAGIVLAIFGVLIFVKFVGILVAALLLVLVFKKFSQSLSERTVAHFWKKTGIGFIALIVTPVAAILLGITVIGLYLAFFLALLYFLLLIIAGVYMCVAAGAFLSKWIKKEAIVDVKWTILGTVAVFLLTFVPFVGWIADLLLFFAAFGTIVMSAFHDAEEKM